MKLNIVKILIITFCVSEIYAQNAQDCKEVIATTEVQKFIVLSSGTGCQYRVKSESGKAVKVFVNATSGTKCVKVSTDGKSETLCPSGPTNQLTSSPPIDVSAVSDTTSSDATTAPTIEATTKATAAPLPPAKPETGGGDQESENSESSDKQEGDVSLKKESVKKANEKETGSSSGAGVEKKLNEQDQQEDEQEKSPVKPEKDDVQLIRLARDTSNDVTVYYVLDGVSKSNPSMILLPGLIAFLILSNL
ncbi:unnamed protein product [Echinostoma caproni]|uniref:Cystatin domain-containing protein n=1 Tax=Echinostoma caproni TaxID=27848 RepID=A0A183ADT4_9TREM|nr:unnamed protein product [Echinostoma caproni]